MNSPEPPRCEWCGNHYRAVEGTVEVMYTDVGEQKVPSWWCDCCEEVVPVQVEDEWVWYVWKEKSHVR